MQFPEGFSVGLDLDRNRGKKSGNARGGEQHVAKKLERLVVAAFGDRAHVPDHAAAGVEIGGGDPQAAAAGVLGRDLRQQLWRHPLRDQPLERPSVHQAFGRRAVLEYVGGGDLEDILAQLVVVAGTEECVGSDQRSDAHAGNQSEFGPVAGLRPADDDAGAVGTVGAAARQGEPGSGPGRQHAREFGIIVAPHPGLGNARDLGCSLVLSGKRRARGQSRRSRDCLRRSFPGRAFFRLREGGGAEAVGVRRRQRPGEGTNDNGASEQARERTDRMHRGESPVNSNATIPYLNPCMHARI